MKSCCKAAVACSTFAAATEWSGYNNYEAPKQQYGGPKGGFGQKSFGGKSVGGYGGYGKGGLSGLSGLGGLNGFDAGRDFELDNRKGSGFGFGQVQDFTKGFGGYAGPFAQDKIQKRESVSNGINQLDGYESRGRADLGGIRGQNGFGDIRTPNTGLRGLNGIDGQNQGDVKCRGPICEGVNPTCSECDSTPRDTCKYTCDESFKAGHGKSRDIGSYGNLKRPSYGASKRSYGGYGRKEQSYAPKRSYGGYEERSYAPQQSYGRKW